MKDIFSSKAQEYAKFRPLYPTDLFDYLLNLVPENKMAWDCATGNGQIARELAKRFEKVMATDMSEEQITQAFQDPRINYSIQSAEHTNFPDSYFDLITVGQAVHWFHFDQFYAEVRRTLKPKGVLALIGYGLLKITPEIDEIIQKFYAEILAGFWPPERIYMDEEYRTVPFPFQEIEMPHFEMSTYWTLDDLLSYFQTWSAVIHYEQKTKIDPISLIRNDFEKSWGKSKERKVVFNLLLKVAKV